MKEKQYKELTTNEKMLVGYIYDLYMQNGYLKVLD